MAGFDFSRFDNLPYYGYGTDPMQSTVGASNPVGTAMQTAAAPAVTGVGQASVSPSGLSGILGYGVNQFPAAPAAKGLGVGGTGLGFNTSTAQLALGGLQTIGSLWQAWEANKLAKEQFKFQKDFANTNLANSMQSYNTTLEDRTRARTFTEGGTDEEAQAYIDKNSLRRT